VVKQMTGVKGLANELEVRLPGDARRTDTDLASAAVKALEWDVQVPHQRIKVRATDGWLTLEGELDWQYQRSAAQRCVRNLIGVRGVSNLITLSSKLTPSNLKQRIEDAFKRHAELEARGIRVDTAGGRVTLDGAVHSVLAWDTASDQLYYSWPIVAASLYTGAGLSADPGRSSFTLGDQTVPLDGRTVRVNYTGPEGTIPTFSALQVVNGDLPLATFQDKIVFIGATTQSLHDINATPFVPQNPPGVPGVEIMASALDTVLSGDYLHLRSGVCAGAVCPIPVRGPMLISIVVSGLLALALTVIRRTNLAIAALVGLLIAGVIVWLAAFILLRTEIPLVAPLSTLFIAFVTPTLERAVSEELEKRRVRGIFEMFISPEMVGQLIEQGIDAMRGRRAELTILFSDIRGFTTMSEKMTPEQLVDVLNEYLGAMTDVIHKHGGTVDKYEGDLVMAFFGAPVPYADHAQRAVRASIEMRVELDRLRQKWEGEGKPFKLEMGIGLNTAEVFVGLVGSGRRVNYTVMGDGVNLASRLQDLTKDLQWPLLIGEATYEKVQQEFDLEFGEARLVKGKTVPVNIYKVLGEKGAPVEQRVRPLYA